MRSGFINNMYDSCFNNMFDNVFSESGGTTPPPFDYDSNTIWWDFRSSAVGNVIETTGTDTLAFAKDYISNDIYRSLISPIKSEQPLIKTNGIDFNQSIVSTLKNPRRLDVLFDEGIANATNGWYCAFNFKPTTATLRILSIGGATGTNALRGELDLTGSRLIRVRINANDGGTQTSLGLSPALTLGVWYTVEVQVNISSGSAVMSCWINGTLQTLTSAATPAHNTTFPASNPTKVVVGNLIAVNGSQALDAEIQQMMFYNGVPNSTIRSSISSYLVGVKP